MKQITTVTICDRCGKETDSEGHIGIPFDIRTVNFLASHIWIEGAYRRADLCTECLRGLVSWFRLSVDADKKQ